ncbi:MAG: protein kinase [Planctomycetota bacterium]
MKICLSCEGVADTDRARCAHCDVPLLPTSAAHFPQRRGEADASNPLIGRVLDGKFLIQGVLGRGGMGTVFRACHTVSLVPMALKLLHPRLSARAEYRRGLLAEARRAGRVVHDHCARVIDVGETEEGTVYLAMELAEGEPLDAWVHGRGLWPAVAVDVLIQIAQALVAIHRAGLVHRDLSSRNVMVAVRDGRPLVKVLDFGIAQSLRLAPAAADGGETAFANPVFSAPEHLAGQEVDARADLYSLGVLAYLLLCGRLPVDQHDARAAARATVAGRLLPLQPTASVPRRLVRLVQRCLSLDREQRPPSSAAVLHELQTMAAGRVRWLPRASVAAFALTVTAAIATFSRVTPPFLQMVGGSLPLQDGPLLADTPVRYLGSRQLRQLEAHFGGFRADRLEVEVRRGSTLQWRRAQQPVVAREGELVLSELQAPWRETLDGLGRASQAGPVDVAFVVPGRAVLGSARLRIDDEPPRLALRMLGDGGDGGERERRLDAATRLRLDCADSGGVADLRLRFALRRGGVHEFALGAPADGALEFDLGAELAVLRGATAPLGPGELQLLAVDRAGNRAEVPPLAFADCDFGAPAVVEVTGPAGEPAIPFLDRRARLRLRLNGVEPDLQVRVTDGDGRDCAAGPTAPLTGQWHEVEIGVANGAETFAPGLYSFVVEDAAGNRCTSTLPLVFRSRRLDAAFEANGDLPAEVAAGELVVGPEGGTFAFSCGPAFAPRRAALRSARGAAVPAAARAEVLAAQQGGCTLRVPPLSPGGYLLTLELDEVGDGRAAQTDVERSLWVLPQQLVVRLPDVRDRFLPPLVRANLFESDGVVLRQGGAVRVDGDHRRFLRGRLWVGTEPATLLPQALPEPDAPGGALLPPSPLLRGRNLLALEVRDVLGRPVDVRMGDAPARTLENQGVQLACIADFHDDPTPPEPVAAELRVEFGQPVRLRLRSPLPFVDGDLGAIQLVVGAAELPPLEVQRAGAGTELAFELPFAVWNAVPELAELPRDEYAAGVPARLAARLGTPAGTWALQVALRTARTTLRVVQLADLGERDVDPRLRALALVPVLAPDGGALADAVPADAPGRGLYRQQGSEPVRGFTDFFVQDREFTLGQYAALVAALPPPAPGLRHADDPLGDERITAAGMVPAAFGGDAAALAAAAGRTPDAAVVGVDWFQAFAATRLLGAVVAGDARLFRLPLGCELELAALGPGDPGAARNGATAHGGRVLAEAFRRWLALPTAPAGPSCAELVAMGDLVSSTPFGRPLHGLDFGVREWVLDLPQGSGAGGEPLLREWIADRELHAVRALELAGSLPAPADLRSRLPPDLQARLRGFAVVRGLAFGEVAGLLDADGRRLPLSGLVYLPESVPGVVRTEQLRRDGRDLMPGQFDPRLLRTGFRVLGDRAFVQRVRGR